MSLGLVLHLLAPEGDYELLLLLPQLPDSASKNKKKNPREGGCVGIALGWSRKASKLVSRT